MQPTAELPPPAAADDAEPPSPPDTPPAGSPDLKARKKAPVFQRGLGGIQLRSKGRASLARKKSGPDDPSGHADAMRRDAAGWGPTGAEGIEIKNHEGNRKFR